MTRAADLTNEQRDALLRHGYPAELDPRGVTGPPDQVMRGRNGWPDLRNHVCFLDGIEIDGHEMPDLDCDPSYCLHCREDRPASEWWWGEDD